MGSAEAGKDSTLFYTLIENGKVHHLDPEAYLVEVIEALRNLTITHRTLRLRCCHGFFLEMARSDCFGFS